MDNLGSGLTDESPWQMPMDIHPVQQYATCLNRSVF